MPGESLRVLRRNLHACQHAPVIGAVVAVVEQADIPVRPHRLQETQQRARAFRKFEAEQALVLQSVRVATHHVAHVQLRHFVVAHVDCAVTRVGHERQQRFLLAPPFRK